MKKLTFATLSFIILFAAQQVAASNDHANFHSQNNPGTTVHEEKEKGNDSTTNETITASVTITTSPTTTSDDFKNHGQYVSSIAQTHPGGNVVSSAARSDIGKKNADADDNDGSGSPTVTPSVSPSISPSVSPTTTPTETPSVTPTETPTATPSVTLTPSPTETQTLETKLSEFLQELQDIISSFKDSLHI
jgi:hypothetical protein